jgi:hypothetical protein
MYFSNLKAGTFFFGYPETSTEWRVYYDVAATLAMMDTLSLVSRFSCFPVEADKNSTRISSDRHMAFVGVVLAAHMQKAIDRCEDAERDRGFKFESSPWTKPVSKKRELERKVML